MANEVKELAKETARATEDIGQKIEAIQRDARGAAGAIMQIGAVINQIHDMQATIASAVEEQTATTNEIARNIAEAAQGRGDQPGHRGGGDSGARAGRRTAHADAAGGGRTCSGSRPSSGRLFVGCFPHGVGDEGQTPEPIAAPAVAPSRAAGHARNGAACRV